MFCNKCGSSAADTHQYCGDCGAYLKTEDPSVQVVETTAKFCKSCGTEVQGRYCESCGVSAVQVQSKLKGASVSIEQLRQTGTALSNAVRDKIPSKIKVDVDQLNLPKLSKQEAIGWAKQGAIFSAIVVGLGLLISFIISMGIKEILFEEYSYLSKSEQGFMNSLINLNGMSFISLFGGKLSWKFMIEDVMKMKFSMMLPFVSLIFIALIMLIGEKIRFSISKQKLTFLGSGIIALMSGVVVSIVGLLLTKSVRLGERELDNLGFGYYNDFSKIKMQSGGSVFSIFLIVFLVAIVVLIVLIKSEQNQNNTMINAVRKIIFTVTGFSFLITLCLVAKTFIEDNTMPEGKGWLVVIMIILYLTGLILSLLVTTNFKLLDVILNGEAASKMKMGIFNMKTSYYGLEEKTENMMKWWLLIAIIIVLILVLVVAYQFWKNREVSLQEAAKEAAFVSIGVGIIFGIIAKMSNLVIGCSLQITDSYYKDMLDTSKYSFQINSGGHVLHGNSLTIGLIAFLLFMLMYWLVVRYAPVLEKFMIYLDQKVVWIGMAVFCVILTITFDIYDFNSSVMDSIESIPYMIEETIEENIGDVLEEIFYY